MGTPSADKLRVYYPGKHIAADGDALTLFTADAGGTQSTIVDAALTQADDYWNGAIGYFTGNVTSALAGAAFHVKDFDAATDTLTLAKNLPAAPAAGDTFRLALGGGFRSSHEVFGLLAGGVPPELVAVTGTNITGLTLKKLAPRLGEGTLTAFFDFSESLLFIKMGSEAYGVGLATAGNPTDAIVFAADGQAWAQVTIVTASLPGSDQTDTFTLAYPPGTMVPDYEGYETAATADGKTRYRLEVAKNTDGGAGVMVGLAANIAKPAGAATTIAGGSSLGLVAASVILTDASTWPTRGFWIRNTTKNDCRYVNYRSGNTLACFGVDWATLAFDAGDNEMFPGDAINDETSGATAVIDQIVVTSGTWAGNDAVGTLLLKKVVGTFGNNNNIRVGVTVMALADGASVLKLRGYTAVAWAAADAIELMADVDIGAGTATALQFETPSAETVAPAGVTFGVGEVALGHLEDGDLVGVWRREWILSGHQARANVNGDTTYSWS